MKERARDPEPPARDAKRPRASHDAEAGGREQRREQMLRAALEVIVERGYADTRIADVAERTGTSPALVIYYFKTRDQLLTEAIRYSEDSWYDEFTRRMEEIPTAVGRLSELIAMNCLPGTDPEPRSYWLLWLDLWALSPRNPGVAAVRQKSDERWRESIRSVVLAGQEAGEFAPVDADDFTITLSALLDGLTVQIALEDSQVRPQRTYDLAMRFAAGQLQFERSGPWESKVSPEDESEVSPEDESEVSPEDRVSPRASRDDWRPAPKRERKRGS